MSIPTIPENIPQTGDMLQRNCGTIVIVEEVYAGAILRTRIMHLPKTSRYDAGATMHIPAELIGVTWQVLA